MLTRKIIFMIVIILCIAGCSKKQDYSVESSSGVGDRIRDSVPALPDYGEDDEFYGDDETDEYGEYSGDDRNDDFYGDDETGEYGKYSEEYEYSKYGGNEQIRLGGHVETGEFVIDRNTLETMYFSNGDDMLVMSLDNYSEEPIIITGAYVEVTDYKPLEEDGYALYRMGDGDLFDSVLGLYAEVDSFPGRFPAVQAEVDEYGNLDYDSLSQNGGDSVPHIEINANDGKNIICGVRFLSPGIYTYQVCIKYLYGNEENVVDTGEIESLYDNDPYSIERAEEEYYDKQDYYLQYI